MGRIGGGEIAMILVVLILLFGARKLPELARSLGSAAREFRKGTEEGKEEAAAQASAESKSSPSETTTT